MENNKLDKLFDAAKQQEPMVSFEDAMEMLEKKADDAGFAGRAGFFNVRNLFFAGISALVIVGGIYLTTNSTKSLNPKLTKPETQQAAQVAEANTEVSRVSAEIAQTPEVLTHQETVKAEQAITSSEEKNVSTMEKEVTAKPLVRKKDEHFGSIVKNAYLLENQTVNINNERGKFKVQFAGDEVTKIELNNVAIDATEWVNYENIVEEAKVVKASMGINSGNRGNKKFVDYLFSTLKDKKLIENNLSTIRFSKDNLLIDGVQADSATHQKLLDQYKSVMGEDIGNRTLYFN